jgi:predicted dehydrogenase
MVRHHEQWKRAREIVRSGELGRVQLVRAVFSYFLDNPNDIRNAADIGGGGLLDIGCYCVLAGRYFFDSEPLRVVAQIDRDPCWKIDRLASVIVDFGEGRHLSFVCGTQMANRQSVEVFGTHKSLEIVVPFNAPPDEMTALMVGSGAQRDLYRREILPPSDQYTMQADAMVGAILDGDNLEFSAADAILQMHVVDAIFKSEATTRWELVDRR